MRTQPHLFVSVIVSEMMGDQCKLISAIHSDCQRDWFRFARGEILLIAGEEKSWFLHLTYHSSLYLGSLKLPSLFFFDLSSQRTSYHEAESVQMVTGS